MKYFYFLAIAALCALLYNLNADDAQNASWHAYCHAYSVNPDNPTPEQIAQYNDAWRGSADEEEALTPEQNAMLN